MLLVRGKRHPNGRTDVIVRGAVGEMWLHVAAGRTMRSGRQYEWGKPGEDTLALAHDMILIATGNALTAELLADELADQWFSRITLEHWAYASFELSAWCCSELTNEVSMHRDGGRKGGVPCPSEN